MFECDLALIAQCSQGPVLLTDEATLLADHAIDASTAQETAGKDRISISCAIYFSTSTVLVVLLYLSMNSADMS